MVKKTKAKNRLDKYYHMAKEQGYRSRAAFKLAQLNAKFDFLSSSHVLIDLCAAPGGWLQVASKHMPVESLILGVDLVPIKPIKGVTTFVGDITTQQCYSRIKSELKHLKADIVLHDGAPNVGVSWEQDAYSQNELVLMSLKLATKFLKPNGIFVTKVFRSVDYNSLMWVFNKLFDSVTATKPVASRTASAEIFVVCQKYTCPKDIDPKLLNPKYVFMESEDILNRHNINSVKQIVAGRPGKIDHTKGLGQYRKSSLAEFVECSNPYQFLADTNEIVFDEDSLKYAQISEPSEAVKENVKDIKLLGVSELRSLIRYRAKIVNALARASETHKEIEEKNSDEELEEKIQSAQRKIKRETKKTLKLEKKKNKAKTNLTDIYEGQELFTIQDPDLGKDVENVEYTDPEDSASEVFYEDDEEIEIDDESRINFMEENLKHYDEVTRKKRKLNEEGDEVVLENMIEESMKKEEASRWYQRKEFENLEDFNQDLDEIPKKLSKKEKKLKNKEKTSEKQDKQDFEIVPQDFPEENDEEALAETIALGTAMLRKKRRREILDSAYNRYSFDDPESLPEWFEKDQKNFYKASLPLTREEIFEARTQVKEFNKRSTKKVMEAIARRKRRLSKKLDKLKPKAEAIASQTDISESIKVQQLQKLYKKEINMNKPKKKYIVSRNFHKDRKKLRKGGRNIRFVDKRLKKDKRAIKSRK